MDHVYPHVLKILGEEIRLLGDKPSILDIGCGPMQYEQHLDATYKGLDIQKHPNARRDPDYLCSASAIPCKDNSFDMVFSVACFCLIVPPHDAFEECLRVLKPGGKFILFDYQQHTIQKLAEALPDIPHNIWNLNDLRTYLIAAGFDRNVENLSWKVRLSDYDRIGKTPLTLLKKSYISLRRIPHATWQVVKARKTP